MTLLEDAVTTADEAARRPSTRRRVARALFPEAEAHGRYRRWRLAFVGAGALGAAGAAIGLAATLGAGGPPALSLSAASFSASVATATKAAQTARISVSVESGVGHDRCVSRSLTTARGMVDFTVQRLLLIRPASACGPLGANPSTARAEVAGHKVFFYSPSVSASNRQVFFYAPSAAPQLTGPSVWHALLVPPGAGAAIYAEPIGHAVSPAPWRVLAALRGAVHVVGNAAIRGVETTEYRGDASLASLVAVYPSIPDAILGVASRTPLSRLTPSASKVHVPVLIWLDAEHRLRRLVLSEPDFEASIPHARDAWIAGFDLRQTVSVPRNPNHPGGKLVTVHLAHVRVIGTARVAIELYDFGTPVHISEPRTNHVAA
jgi:hypothetical protein